MNFKCSNLPELKCFSAIELLGGTGGLDHTITWVYISQATHISEWVHGGELVFITGIGEHYTDAHLCRLLEECAANSTAGVVIMCSPEHIRRVPNQMIQLANQLNMPLYRMPWDLKLVDVTREIADTIITNQLKERSSAGFFSELLFARNISQDTVRQMGVHCGADLSRPAAIMILRPDFRGDSYYRRIDYDNLMTRLEKEMSDYLRMTKRSVVSCIYMDEIFFYISCSDNASAAEVCKKIRSFGTEFMRKHPDYRLRGGMGRAGATPEEIRSSYAEARKALSHSEKNKDEISIYFFAELGIISLLINADNQQELISYCRSVLSPLADSDKHYGTSYISTLEAYLDSNCSLAAAAEKMFIHRNTMVYRVNKIRELLKIDFNDMNAKAECVNALHIMKHFDIEL